MRKTYELNDSEWHEFRRLGPDSDIWGFWMRAANSRGLDHKSLIGHTLDNKKFTGLPLGHGKYWCWPDPLTVKRPPHPPP